MAALLFVLWGIVTPLLASGFPSHLQIYEPIDGIMKPDQTAIFNHLKSLDHAYQGGYVDFDFYMNHAKEESKRLMKDELLEAFPGEEYRPENILPVLLDESPEADKNTLDTNIKRAKELGDFFFSKMHLCKYTSEDFNTEYATTEEIKLCQLKSIALQSFRVMYPEKAQLGCLGCLAKLREKGGRIHYYHKQLRRFDSWPETKHRENYYKFLKGCGVADPEALGDLPPLL